MEKLGRVFTGAATSVYNAAASVGSAVGTAGNYFMNRNIETIHPTLYGISRELNLDSRVPLSNFPLHFTQDGGLYGSGQNVGSKDVSRYPSINFKGVPKSVVKAFRALPPQDRALVKAMIVRREHAKYVDRVNDSLGLYETRYQEFDAGVPAAPPGLDFSGAGKWGLLLGFLHAQSSLSSIGSTPQPPQLRGPSSSQGSAVLGFGLSRFSSYGNAPDAQGSPRVVPPLNSDGGRFKVNTKASQVARQRRSASSDAQAAKAVVSGDVATALGSLQGKEQQASSALASGASAVVGLQAPSGETGNIEAAAGRVAASVDAADGAIDGFFGNLSSALSSFNATVFESVDAGVQALNATLASFGSAIAGASTPAELAAVESGLQSACANLTVSNPSLNVSSLIEAGDVRGALDAVCSSLSTEHAALLTDEAAAIQGASIDEVSGECEGSNPSSWTQNCRTAAQVAEFLEPCADGPPQGGVAALRADFAADAPAPDGVPQSVNGDLGQLQTLVSQALSGLDGELRAECMAELDAAVAARQADFTTTPRPDTTPADTTPADTTPRADTTPVDTTPADTTPADTTPRPDTTPADTTPAPSTPPPSTPSPSTPAAECSAQGQVVSAQLASGANISCVDGEFRVTNASLEGTYDVGSVENGGVLPGSSQELSGAQVSGVVQRQADGSGRVNGSVSLPDSAPLGVDGAECALELNEPAEVVVPADDMPEAECPTPKGKGASGGADNSGVIGGVLGALGALALVLLAYVVNKRRKKTQIAARDDLRDGRNVLPMQRNLMFSQEPYGEAGPSAQEFTAATYAVPQDAKPNPAYLVPTVVSQGRMYAEADVAEEDDFSVADGGYLDITAADDASVADSMANHEFPYFDAAVGTRRVLVQEACQRFPASRSLQQYLESNGTLKLFVPRKGSGLTTQLTDCFNDTYYSLIPPKEGEAVYETSGQPMYASTTREEQKRKVVAPTNLESILVLPAFSSGETPQIDPETHGWKTAEDAFRLAETQGGKVVFYIPKALIDGAKNPSFQRGADAIYQVPGRHETSDKPALPPRLGSRLASAEPATATEQSDYLAPVQVAGASHYAQPKSASQPSGGGYQLFRAAQAAPVANSPGMYAVAGGTSRQVVLHPGVVGCMSRQGIPESIRCYFDDHQQPTQEELLEKPLKNLSVDSLQRCFPANVPADQQLILVMPKPRAGDLYYAGLQQDHELAQCFGWKTVEEISRSRLSIGDVVVYVPAKLTSVEDTYA